MLCCAISAMLGYPDFRSYGWQWVLCRAMRHFSCSNCVAVILLKVWYDDRQDMSLQHNCVAVMLLKARGWRGTSLPREGDNVWFSNPVRVLLLPITWRIRKSEPVPGSFHASILSPRRLTSFANVGLSRAQLVPSYEYGKWQYILQKQDFQKHNSYRIVLSYRYCYLTTWSLWWNDRRGIITRYSINRAVIWVILRCKVSQVAV